MPDTTAWKLAYSFWVGQAHAKTIERRKSDVPFVGCFFGCYRVSCAGQPAKMVCYGYEPGFILVDLSKCTKQDGLYNCLLPPIPSTEPCARARSELHKVFIISLRVKFFAALLVSTVSSCFRSRSVSLIWTARGPILPDRTH